MVRFLRPSSRLSRVICLACFSVGRRMDQFIWPKMLVLIARGCQLLLPRFNYSLQLGHSPSTQYGHSICSRLTLPHPEHRLSDVMSFKPLPAMNRWRFLRYDVFFFGTALSMPSQISASDGIDGSDSDGNASAPKGVLIAPKGCERRCRNGRFRMGRMGPLRPGSRVCHSGGSGRASAIVTGSVDGDGRGTPAIFAMPVMVLQNVSAPQPVRALVAPSSAISLPGPGCPFPAPASPRESPPVQRP
jgi:hypothetical protein